MTATWTLYAAARTEPILGSSVSDRAAGTNGKRY